MKIIISPAKTMEIATDSFIAKDEPVFIKEANELLKYLKSQSYENLKNIWKCSDNIATLNFNRLQNMNLYEAKTPAIFSFSGLAYKYMMPKVFTYEEFDYINKNLRILSGFYGILRPFDKVMPYRLEMQAKVSFKNYNNLYDFWGSKISDYLFSESNIIINLASYEYSKCILKHLNQNIRFITCVFGELKNGKVIEKGTLVKMARGEMVRFMAEHNIKDVNDIKKFNRLNYIYEQRYSDENRFVFIKK